MSFNPRFVIRSIPLREKILPIFVGSFLTSNVGNFSWPTLLLPNSLSPVLSNTSVVCSAIGLRLLLGMVKSLPVSKAETTSPSVLIFVSFSFLPLSFANKSRPATGLLRVIISPLSAPTSLAILPPNECPNVLMFFAPYFVSACCLSSLRVEIAWYSSYQIPIPS